MVEPISSYQTKEAPALRQITARTTTTVSAETRQTNQISRMRTMPRRRRSRAITAYLDDVVASRQSAQRLRVERGSAHDGGGAARSCRGDYEPWPRLIAVSIISLPPSTCSPNA